MTQMRPRPYLARQMAKSETNPSTNASKSNTSQDLELSRQLHDSPTTFPAVNVSHTHTVSHSLRFSSPASQSHHLSGYEEDTYKDSSLFWHLG